MFCFVETDTKEQKKYEQRIQTFVDNTVNDLHHEIKFEYIFEMFETFLFFFKQKYILFLEVYNFKISKNLILGIFFAVAGTKKQLCIECCTGKTY